VPSNSVASVPRGNVIARPDLGQIFLGNFFDFHPDDGQLMVFVNTFAFVLHDPAPYVPGILDTFWKQLLRILHPDPSTA
jgi:hypothetical protein